LKKEDCNEAVGREKNKTKENGEPRGETFMTNLPGETKKNVVLRNWKGLKLV